MFFKSYSEIETKEIAKDIARNFESSSGVIALIGDLGAGKTTFSQGFAKALGVQEKVISPTFILMRQYSLNDGRTFYHLDLYRLEDEVDMASLGLSEILEDDCNIVLIEWAEKILDKLPPKTMKIKFKKIDENLREIRVD